MEEEAFAAGCAAVCGADEAGAGPLAGPVYAAAVILPPGLMIDGLNDSKKLSAKKRDALFDVICGEAMSFAVSAASVEEIEELNILNARLLAMSEQYGMDVETVKKYITKDQLEDQVKTQKAIQIVVSSATATKPEPKEDEGEEKPAKKPAKKPAAKKAAKKVEADEETPAAEKADEE